MKDTQIDHTIDVRYEPDLEEAFNKFIKKWCGKWYSHLIDTDENDGQFIRDKIQALHQKHQAEMRALSKKAKKADKVLQQYKNIPPSSGSFKWIEVINSFDELLDEIDSLTPDQERNHQND